MQKFNDIEALKISREIELRGADIYARALKLARNDDVREMLSRLHGDELQHAAVFEELSRQALEHAEEDEFYPPEASMFLAAFAADIAFPGGLMKLASDEGLSDPRVVLEQAVQAKKNSILFFQEVIEASSNATLRKYLGDIVREERSHLMGLLTQIRNLG